MRACAFLIFPVVGDNVSSVQRGNKVLRPCARMHPRLSLVAMMNDDRPSVIGNAVAAESIATHKGLTSETGYGCIGVFSANALIFHLCLRVALASGAISEIDRRAQKRAEIADRMCGASEMFPTGGDDVGQKLSAKLRFAHQFEDQKFMKAQRQQAVEVRGEPSWLS